MALPDINTQYYECLITIKTKLKTNPYILKQDNVVVGESSDLLGLTDSYFPRIEILPLIDKGQGYVCQRDMEHNYQFGIIGYIRRDKEEISERDVKNIIAMGEKSRALIFELFEDKQKGEIKANLFDYIEGSPILDFDFELFDNISTFTLGFISSSQLKDTEI